MITFETPYGTFEIAAGGFESNYRWDRFVPNDGGRPVMERKFVLNREDMSPRVDTYSAQHGKTGPAIRQYRGIACECCYLGFPHTVALHDARVDAYDRRK